MVGSEILDRSIRLREMEPCNWCLCGWGGGDEVAERLNEKWKERACPNENDLLCLQRVLCDSLFWPKQTAGREFIHRRGADKRVDLSRSLYSLPVSIFSISQAGISCSHPCNLAHLCWNGRPGSTDTLRNKKHGNSDFFGLFLNR